MRAAMAEPFKNLINAEVVAASARTCSGSTLVRPPRLRGPGAAPGLDALELKARVLQVADALVAVLPADVDRACGLLEASLGPPGRGRRPLRALRTSAAGLAGWAVWPLTEAVACMAIDAPERGLLALHAMTQRLTAEFAIRPFIVRHPALCFATVGALAGGTPARMCGGWSARAAGRACPGACGCRRWWPTRRRRCRCCGAAGRPQRVRAAQRRQPPQRHRQGPPRAGGRLAGAAPARRRRRASPPC
jgi:hypothetical protein